MSRDPEVTAAALTDVAYFVEDDNGEWATVFDGEVIEAELVDEPAPVAGQVYDETGGWIPTAEAVRFADTGWLPKVPELNPRLRYPDEENPLFDELDGRRLHRQRWTKTMHALVVARLREQEQYHLEEGAYRDRVWEIEHASPLLNQLRQP